MKALLQLLVWGMKYVVVYLHLHLDFPVASLLIY